MARHRRLTDQGVTSKKACGLESRRRPGTPPSAARAAIMIWTRVHGIVSLELTGIFDNQSIEAQRLIDLEIDDALRPLEPAGAPAALGA